MYTRLSNTATRLQEPSPRMAVLPLAHWPAPSYHAERGPAQYAVQVHPWPFAHACFQAPSTLFLNVGHACMEFFSPCRVIKSFI